ncbi:MAG TPA: glycosyltransferase family 4 protein [Anaeromyxobacter sp.]
MDRPRTVLYVEHAGELGGACVSLREMLSALDPARVRPIVAMIRPSDELKRFYADRGIEAFSWEGIAALEHTTARWASVWRPASWPLGIRTIAGWRRGERRTLGLVERVGPDLVHLSSAVLAPSARALHRSGVPFVWHVREMPVRGHLGARSAALRAAMRDWPDALVFLSGGARDAWGAPPHSAVVPEFVDLARFRPDLDRGRARARLGLDGRAPVVLYVGGMSAIKGVLTLLGALTRVRRRLPELVCLMPGGATAPGTLVRFASALVPALTLTGRIREAIASGRLDSVCRRLPFTSDMPEMMAASDVLAFPSTVDHFARPVVEAGAMARPVVASRLPMIEEQAGREGGAILVRPGDARELADALLEVLARPDRARALGERGRETATRRFDLRRNTDEVMALYDRVLESRSISRSGSAGFTRCA